MDDEEVLIRKTILDFLKISPGSTKEEIGGTVELVFKQLELSDLECGCIMRDGKVYLCSSCKELKKD